MHHHRLSLGGEIRGSLTRVSIYLAQWGRRAIMPRPPQTHRVGFHDLEFSHYEPVPYRHPSGAVSRRWVPVGMPRINPILEDSVVFLFRRDPQTGEMDPDPE